ncbi:hypothetical protein OCU04_011631 [Sclerotinia nivalis]|uniref:Amidase domain-containing protein n=1 Tax=Sclerotinia nivalis TaxID=352851 RepID=A0A9X0ABY6_9HELO|nr:hypothetical protein OCU04_011631 [Sclerotinia nivalis]
MSFQVISRDFSGRQYTAEDYHTKWLTGKLTILALYVSTVPAAAEKFTARYAAGEPLGLLDATAIKDVSDVTGYRMTFGRAANEELFPISKTTTWPIQKLEECGAITLGKTNVYEYGTTLQALISSEERLEFHIPRTITQVALHLAQPTL